MEEEGAPAATGVDQDLEDAIRTLLAGRTATSSICPSEAARAVRPNDWRRLMEPAHRAARRLVLAGEIDVTQGGQVVNPSIVKGPIRIRRRRD